MPPRMHATEPNLSRRGLLAGRFLRRLTEKAVAPLAEKVEAVERAFNPPPADVLNRKSQIDNRKSLAVIRAHLCLAHRSSFCTVCSERCPVEGAIVIEEGRPRIDLARCTGCGICRDVCPAPENAVILIPPRKVPR